MIRRQLPAYSPLTPGRLALAAWDAIRSPEGAREAFRAYLRERFNAPEAVLMASGTHALQLALEVAMAKRRGLVALPAYSCYDIVTAAVGAKVEATFYDIDPVSLSPDMQSLTQALEAGATTVVAGNLYGFPLDWDAIRAACDAHGAFLIEDAAQGLG
ncbi:MAG: aminotransferase class I/II-fold pyridoxal phosphate-dependent enzyme, partial [Longimicrobiales bacterium]